MPPYYYRLTYGSPKDICGRISIFIKSTFPISRNQAGDIAKLYPAYKQIKDCPEYTVRGFETLVPGSVLTNQIDETYLIRRPFPGGCCLVPPSGDFAPVCITRERPDGKYENLFLEVPSFLAGDGQPKDVIQDLFRDILAEHCPGKAASLGDIADVPADVLSRYGVRVAHPFAPTAILHDAPASDGLRTSISADLTIPANIIRTLRSSAADADSWSQSMSIQTAIDHEDSALDGLKLVLTLYKEHHAGAVMLDASAVGPNGHEYRRGRYDITNADHALFAFSIEDVDYTFTILIPDGGGNTAPDAALLTDSVHTGASVVLDFRTCSRTVPAGAFAALLGLDPDETGPLDYISLRLQGPDEDGAPRVTAFIDMGGIEPENIFVNGTDRYDQTVYLAGASIINGNEPDAFAAYLYGGYAGERAKAPIAYAKTKERTPEELAAISSGASPRCVSVSLDTGTTEAGMLAAIADRS